MKANSFEDGNGWSNNERAVTPIVAQELDKEVFLKLSKKYSLSEKGSIQKIISEMSSRDNYLGWMRYFKDENGFLHAVSDCTTSAKKNWSLEYSLSGEPLQKIIAQNNFKICHLCFRKDIIPTNSKHIKRNLIEGVTPENIPYSLYSENYSNALEVLEFENPKTGDSYKDIIPRALNLSFKRNIEKYSLIIEFLIDCIVIENIPASLWYFETLRKLDTEELRKIFSSEGVSYWHRLSYAMMKATYNKSDSIERNIRTIENWYDDSTVVSPTMKIFSDHLLNNKKLNILDYLINGDSSESFDNFEKINSGRVIPKDNIKFGLKYTVEEIPEVILFKDDRLKNETSSLLREYVEDFERLLKRSKKIKKFISELSKKEIIYLLSFKIPYEDMTIKEIEEFHRIILNTINNSYVDKEDINHENAWPYYSIFLEKWGLSKFPFYNSGKEKIREIFLTDFREKVFNKDNTFHLSLVIYSMSELTPSGFYGVIDQCFMNDIYLDNKTLLKIIKMGGFSGDMLPSWELALA